MHTKKNLRDWFKNKYWLALKFISICYKNRIYNINEKRAKIACFAKEEVIVPISIKEIYVSMLENCILLIVVECIFANRKAMPPLVIILGVLIKETWFYENISGYEVVTMSPTRYINEGICMV
jgi:hypothetical protein